MAENPNIHPPRFELIPPQGDKGWSFQVFGAGQLPYIENLPEEIRPSLLILLQTPFVKRAKPFLQGDCQEWLMVEFWTDDETLIAQAAAFLESSLQ